MPVDEHTITIDQVPVFFRSAPADGPPPLYLHGIPTSSDDFAAFLAGAGGIAPDLPGFGRSGKGGHLDYSLGGHANFIEALLARLDVDRVKLVVHGWGAGGGLTFAQRHPERVERLVLIDALPLLPGFSWHRLARVWRRPVLGELAMGATTKWALARILRAASADPAAWPSDAVKRVWEQFDQGTQRAILRLHRSIDEAGLAAAGDQLASLSQPSLVIWGERDPWLPAQLADAYRERLPNATSETVSGAGHWPWLQRAEVVARVRSFLGEP